MLPDYHLRRYAMRLDGFASINAPFTGDELRTKPLQFAGSRLELNLSTSSVGGIWVEIQDVNGAPLPGFALDDCGELVGDEIAKKVTWKGSAHVSKLAG